MRDAYLLVQFHRPFAHRMKTLSFLSLLVSALLAAVAQAQNPEALFDKAKQAKADGRHDEAEELVNRGKKLERELRERERGGDRERAPRSENLRPEVDQSHGSVKHEHSDRPDRPFGEAAEHRTERLPDSERMRHLQEAIKHLRVAGLHDAAEHLEQLARRQHAEESQHGQPPRREQPRQDEVRREIREMQSRFQEMHGQIRKMAGALEELREQVKRQGEGARDRQ